ncbi:MAG: hypothetical protein ABGZ35_15755 [Planctomycetaceae bacterium]
MGRTASPVTDGTLTLAFGCGKLLKCLSTGDEMYSKRRPLWSILCMASDYHVWTDQELISWLDERLPATRMSELEQQLRTDDSLRIRVANLIQHRDQGGHSVGEIWYRARLSCPGRSEWGGYLLGTLPSDVSDYLEFHLLTIGCRLCQANLQDLQEHSDSTGESTVRRRRFFESSAGFLESDESSRF